MSLPPLLMIAEGRRPRPRKAPTCRPRELALHMRVAATLRKLARPDWRWSHFPAGEQRDERTDAKLKAMGLQPGWPDFLIVAPSGRLHCLELKRAGEDLSDAQEGFQAWATRHGVAYVTAHSFAEAMTAFDAWGCLADLPRAESHRAQR